MSWLEWSSSVIGSTAWPIALIIVALIFRGQINKLLKRIKGAKYGEAEVQFREELDKVEAQLGEMPPAPAPDADEYVVETPRLPTPTADATLPSEPSVPHSDAKLELLQIAIQQEKFNEIAKLSPNAAVLNAWRDVELELERSFNKSGLSKQATNRGAFQTAIHLHEMGVIDTPIMQIIRDLRNLRNTAAHVEQVSITDAFRFQTLARDVIRRLRDALAR